MNIFPTRAVRAGFAKILCASAMIFVTFSTHSLRAEDDNVDWRYYGNDLSNTRYQNVDQITPSNVSQLKPAWVFHTGVNDPKMSMEMSPVVVDGTMYVTTGNDDVFALNAATGKQRWAYHSTDMVPISQLPLCCSHNNRGVGVGQEKVFVARLDATLVALDVESGHTIWKATVDDWHKGYSMTIPPLYVDGMVIAGAMLWTFNALTIPGAGGATAAPVAYVANGREFVAYEFGGNTGEDNCPLGDAFIAFALPKELEPSSIVQLGFESVRGRRPRVNASTCCCRPWMTSSSSIRIGEG